MSSDVILVPFPVGIYLFKANDISTKTDCENVIGFVLVLVIFFLDKQDSGNWMPKSYYFFVSLNGLMHKLIIEKFSNYSPFRILFSIFEVVIKNIYIELHHLSLRAAVCMHLNFKVFNSHPLSFCLFCDVLLISLKTIVLQIEKLSHRWRKDGRLMISGNSEYWKNQNVNSNTSWVP